MKTLANLKASSIPAAVGIAACDPRFLTLANEAQDRIAAKGRWWGSIRRLRLCITQRCITWPPGVATVEGFNVSGGGAPLRNGWYEFQENARTTAVSDCSCDSQQLLDRELTPQYRNPTENSYIRIYPVAAGDAGAVVLLQGADHNGNPIRNSDVGGWFDGEKLTLASPFSTSTALFSKPGLLAVQKPITKNYLNVFAVNAVSGVETQIAKWGPSETNPAYRRSALVSLPRGCTLADTGDGCGPGLTNCTTAIADAIVRLEPVQLVVDSDWLLIGNVSAMKSAMKALQKEDQNDYVGARQEMANAVTRLREELAMFEPPERIQINVELGTGLRTMGGVI